MAEFFLSLLPIAALLICLLIIKLPAKYASLIAFAIAMAEFVLWFEPGAFGIWVTNSKGLAMAVFVGLIALGAMLLYNLVDVAGGFSRINDFLAQIFKDRFALFIMITWTFSAFLQGIAGYGIPAVIATTILVKAGYDVARSAAASLLGWSAVSGALMRADVPLVLRRVNLEKRLRSESVRRELRQKLTVSLSDEAGPFSTQVVEGFSRSFRGYVYSIAQAAEIPIA